MNFYGFDPFFLSYMMFGGQKTILVF